MCILFKSNYKLLGTFFKMQTMEHRSQVYFSVINTAIYLFYIKNQNSIRTETKSSPFENVKAKSLSAQQLYKSSVPTQVARMPPELVP